MYRDKHLGSEEGILRRCDLQVVMASPSATQPCSSPSQASHSVRLWCDVSANLVAFRSARQVAAGGSRANSMCRPKTEIERSSARIGLVAATAAATLASKRVVVTLIVASNGSSPVAFMVNTTVLLFPGLRRVSENSFACNSELSACGTSHTDLREEKTRPGSQSWLESRSSGTASVPPGHRTPVAPQKL